MCADKTLWTEYLKAINYEVAPALGCTEPISLAFACAKAVEYVAGEPVDKIVAKVSPNLMKNGMGVTVPGTGMLGLPIAAAVGALCGDASAELEVLKNLDAQCVAAGKKMLDAAKVTVTVAATEKALYTEANIYTANHTVRVCIADEHTNVFLIEKDGVIEFEKTVPEGNDFSKPYSFKDASMASICAFASNVPFEDIVFILKAGEINAALAEEGLKNEYGLHIGQTLKKQMDHGFLSDDLLTKILVRSSAASDARMGGATLPAMSNSGSGNQGIAATMPVVVVADYIEATDEERARALILSHLTAVYIHSTFPSLSGLCAASTASMGAAAGMAWLLGKGDEATISRAISSMVGDLTGIVCDGAANSCAMKVSSSVASAFKAVLMALDNVRVTGSEGLVSEDVDASIRNLGNLVSVGMCQTDQQILKIMVEKTSESN